MAAKVADGVHPKLVRSSEPRDVVAQPRSLAPPPSDADVRVVALREHPSVAAGHHSELHDRRALDSGGLEIGVRHVSLQRDPVDDVGVQPHGASHDPVRSVRADEHVRAHRVSVDPHVDSAAVRRDVRHPGTVAKRRPGSSSLLGEVQVEPPPLRHEDERCRVRAREAAAVAKPDPEPVDDVLDDGFDGAGRPAERASGEPSSARLVPGEARAVGQEHLRPAAREAQRRRRTRRSGADDHHVVAFHTAMVGAGRPRN